MRWEKFGPEHEHLVALWLSQRGIDPRSVDEMPPTGFVALDDNEPVAIAFLRRCEGGVAIFDGLISNPNSDSRKRHFGIDLVVTQVIEYSKLHGISRILAYSVDDGTLKRARAHGFALLPHRLIGLDLGDKNGVFDQSLGDA